MAIKNLAQISADLDLPRRHKEVVVGGDGEEDGGRVGQLVGQILRTNNEDSTMIFMYCFIIDPSHYKLMQN